VLQAAPTCASDGSRLRAFILHAFGKRESALVRLHRNSCSLPSSSGIQVIIKFNMRSFLFDEISANETRYCDLLRLLKARLGSEILDHARLMDNGRILRMGETLEQAGVMGCCILEVFLCNPGGAKLRSRTHAHTSTNQST